jgi:pyrroline-5-carboxylate reductase
MSLNKIGFIGAGRITRIFLHALKRAGSLPADVVVSDLNRETLDKLQEEFPSIRVVQGDNRPPASQALVILALHPPAIQACLQEIQACLGPGAAFLSLAPKWTIARLSKELGSACEKLMRMIPNAPSIVNAGYNPVTFSSAFSLEEKRGWISWLSAFGDCPEVREETLEAYAILTAMGPTYLWFQFYELLRLAQSFGLQEQEALQGISAMVRGSVSCMLSKEMSEADVLDLVPVKPLVEVEASIVEMYHTKLEPLYQKLKA